MSEEFEKKSVDHHVAEREDVGPDSELQRGLKNRHAQMISWVPLRLEDTPSIILIDCPQIAASGASLALVSSWVPQDPSPLVVLWVFCSAT